MRAWTGPLTKVVFSATTAAFVGGIVMFFELREKVAAAFSIVANSHQLAAIGFIFASLAGFAGLVSLLVFRWDEKLYSFRRPSYSRDKMDRFREAVRAVKDAWYKLPHALWLDDGKERDAHFQSKLEEFRTASGDYLLEKEFCGLILKIDDCAERILALARTKTPQPIDVEHLIKTKENLAIAALELLDKTKAFAIYE